MSQHMEALKQANDVRLARAELKKSILSGHTWVEEVLRDPPPFVHNMSVIELLSAQKRWGKVRSKKMVERSGALPQNPEKKLGSMTHRERTKLADFLESYVSQWS